jgi:hypothetical protein
MRWLTLLLPFFLINCTAEQWTRSVNPPPLVLHYDDFGPEDVARGLLGPRGLQNQPITIHHGGNRLVPGNLRVNMLQAMSHLRFAVRRLPRTAEAQPLREKLRATYSRIYPSYRTRRDAMMSAPFSTIGRGSINRAMILPPMPPSI